MAIYNSIFTGAEVDAILSSSPTLQVITSSGTYTPGATVKAIKVTLIGGGGGGGGADGKGAGTIAIGSGGAGAGSTIKTITPLESSYSVVVGAGGAGGAGLIDGGDGGTSTFIGDDTATTSMSAFGGEGGLGFVGDSSNLTYQGADGGGSSGGDINLTGSDSASVSNLAGDGGQLGHSGGSHFGGAVRSPAANADGFNATTFGSGGSGAFSKGVDTNYTGGDGYQGVCIIEEYY